MTKVAAAIVNQNNAAGDPHRVMFTENHDMASNQNHGRIPEIINPGGNPYKPTYCKFFFLCVELASYDAWEKTCNTT